MDAVCVAVVVCKGSHGCILPRDARQRMMHALARHEPNGPRLAAKLACSRNSQSRLSLPFHARAASPETWGKQHADADASTRELPMTSHAQQASKQAPVPMIHARCAQAACNTSAALPESMLVRAHRASHEPVAP
jgi:hypothetical protein